MQSGAVKGLRVAGVCVAAVIYLATGLPSCAGHAGYFRALLMRRAECTGTTLDAAGCAEPTDSGHLGVAQKLGLRAAGFPGGERRCIRPSRRPSFTWPTRRGCC